MYTIQKWSTYIHTPKFPLHISWHNLAKRGIPHSIPYITRHSEREGCFVLSGAQWITDNLTARSTVGRIQQWRHQISLLLDLFVFAGTGAIVRLPQCQWSKPDGYGKISQCITTTKHSKAKTVCIFLGIYCTGLTKGSSSDILNWFQSDMFS